MRQLTVYIGLTTLALLVFLLAACSTGSLSASLTVIEDACEAANVTVPILEASGVIPVAIANSILSYSGSIATAAAQASQELLTTDPAAEQATKIIADFAAVAIPSLGPVGPEVQAIVNAIKAAVDLFVNQFKSPTAQKTIRSGALDHQRLGMWDRRRLGQLHNKFTATASKSKSLIK